VTRVTDELVFRMHTGPEGNLDGTSVGVEDIFLEVWSGIHVIALVTFGFKANSGFLEYVALSNNADVVVALVYDAVPVEMMTAHFPTAATTQ